MRRRTLVVIAALALMPGVAYGQDLGPGLTEEPPIDLPADEEPTPETPDGTFEETDTGTDVAADELADTGFDAGLIALAGTGLLLAGAGLRLRRDA